MKRSALALLLVSTVLRAETHRFRPTVGYPTFAVRPPVLTVKPGDVLESESLWGEWYEKEGGKWPGEVGPIAIEGAKPGDTLVVEIRKVRPNRDTAVSTQGRNFGALVPDGGDRRAERHVPARALRLAARPDGDDRNARHAEEPACRSRSHSLLSSRAKRGISEIPRRSAPRNDKKGSKKKRAGFPARYSDQSFSS